MQGYTFYLSKHGPHRRRCGKSQAVSLGAGLSLTQTAWISTPTVLFEAPKVKIESQTCPAFQQKANKPL